MQARREPLAGSPPRPGRVTVVFHEPVLGGATRSVLRLVPILAERGWRFSFWLPRPSPAHEELSDLGYDVDGRPRYIEHSLRAWRLPPGPRRRLAGLPSYVGAYRRFLRSRSPDLVHANAIITVSEALVAKRLGFRVLLHAHEMLPSGVRGKALRRTAWHHLDEVVAVSEASAVALTRRGRVPRLVHEGAPVPAEPVSPRADPAPFTVGTVAVVSTRKGSDVFVETARRLLATGGDYRFEMLGAPNDAIEQVWADDLLRRAREIGIKHTAHADVWEAFRRWDAFVLPSRADPFPISMLEAMASGLPVIGTRIDGIAEQVTADCGYLVEPDDPGQLSEAIAKLRRLGQSERAALGAAGRHRVQESFTLEHQADALERAYLAALSS